MNFYEGKRVIITGASAGLGAEYAREFHSRGAHVVLIARRAERLHELTDELNQLRAGSASFVVSDLSSDADRRDLVRRLQEERVDILVNNAGFGSYGEFADLPVQRELDMVSTNCHAVVELTHAVIPQMQERRQGGIIILASVCGFQPLPYMATYAATKAFDLFFGFGLHHELKTHGVRVTTVCPGPTATEFGRVASVPLTVTTAFRDTPRMVILETLKAFDRGSPCVVTGFRSRLLTVFSRVVPLWLSTLIVAHQLRGRKR